MNIKALKIIIAIALPTLAIISLYGVLTGIDIDMAKLLNALSKFKFTSVHLQILKAGNMVNNAIDTIENIGITWKNASDIIEVLKALYNTIIGGLKAILTFILATLYIASVPFMAIIDIIKGVFGFFGALAEY